MSKFFYFQTIGGEETWQPCPAEYRKTLEAEKSPAFFTVLAVSQPVEGLAYEEKTKLRYAGDLYFDFDSSDITHAIEQATKFLLVLEGKGVDVETLKLFATGGRGFHCEVPVGTFLSKVPKDGIQFLPLIYREMAFDLAVDSLDLRVYSAGRGRMWRSANVKRSNGHYKVPITWAELKDMTAKSYQAITAQPREMFALPPPKLCMDLMVMFDAATNKVKDRAGKKKKRSNEGQILKKLELPSLDALLEGRGIRPGIGFHQLALQLAIVADSSGWTEEQLVAKAAGLVENHQSDGNRYNTPQRRSEELVRMHRYCADNPCYEFSVGALKVLLSHEAPDLDGIPVAKADIDQAIAEAKDAPAAAVGEIALDEYADVASSVSLSKFGVWANSEEGGKRRISAVSFDDVHILCSPQTGQVSCYEAEVLINGERKGRQTLELDVFNGVQSFNKFAGRMSHALQGSDSHVRALMMRIAEKGRKEGKTFFVLNREGLDMINIVNHSDPDLREPFMVWADNSGVLLDPRVQGKGFEFSFQGFPDPRGSFRTDLTDAPKLVDWIEEPSNKNLMRATLQNMLTCQRPDVIGKTLGWYTACFYRMLFHKAYSKFPLMHVNGAAGSGKTEMNLSMLRLFFYNQEPKALTPGSTLFAIQQHMAGAASIPLMLDEYKPAEMSFELHNKLKLMFRDSYNCRDVTRGGGTRDNDDYRSLYSTQLASPMVFVAEAAEEEAAVMERVVLVTMVKPPSSVAMTWSTRFHFFQRNHQLLALLGQYLAQDTVLAYSVDQLIEDFDPLFKDAQDKFMLNEKDLKGDLTDEALQAKQGAKERTVYNYTVARFGLRRFRALVKDIFDDEFEALFETLESSIYDRMTDLLPSTQPEWVKVLSQIAVMSINVDKDNSAMAIRKGVEYAFVNRKGREVLELSARSAYHRYRAYARQIGQKPLFPGDGAFLHGLKDSPAVVDMGPGEVLKVPGGVFYFDMAELARMGVEQFSPH